MQIILYLLDPQCLLGGKVLCIVLLFYFLHLILSSNDKHESHERINHSFLLHKMLETHETWCLIPILTLAVTRACLANQRLLSGYLTELLMEPMAQISEQSSVRKFKKKKGPCWQQNPGLSKQSQIIVRTSSSVWVRWEQRVSYQRSCGVD